MHEIKHQIRIHAEKARVYQALATLEGLASWWTRTTSGNTVPGGEIAFRFGGHVITMRVEALEKAQKVAWLCLGSHPEWVDTQVMFSLTEEEDKTVVDFSHRNWRKTTMLFPHCSMKWAVFLLSLKQYLETGTGAPFPDDLAI